MKTSVLMRLFAVVAIFVGLAIASMHSVAAQTAEATITIHKAECFTGVGPDIFEECHDDGLGDVSFDVNGTAAVSDETGVVAFEGPAGTVTITEDPAVFDTYLGAYVYCRDLTDDVVLFDGSATDSGGVVELDVEVGDEIVCDWYNITEAAAAPAPTTTAGGTTTLPATGTGGGSSNQQLFVLLGLVGGLMALGLGLRKRSAL